MGTGRETGEEEVDREPGRKLQVTNTQKQFKIWLNGLMELYFSIAAISDAGAETLSAETKIELAGTTFAPIHVVNSIRIMYFNYRCTVPDNMVGAVLGIQGQGINEIVSLSGAKVTVSKR